MTWKAFTQETYAGWRLRRKRSVPPKPGSRPDMEEKGWSEMIRANNKDMPLCMLCYLASSQCCAGKAEGKGWCVCKDGGGHAEVALETASHSSWVAAVERERAATSGLNDGSTSLKALDKCQRRWHHQ